MDKKKKTVKRIRSVLRAAVLLAVGMAGGYGLGMIVGGQMENVFPNAGFLPVMLFLLVGMLVSVYLHIAIHEAGHLVFGLMTGYRFSSYRFLSFMWLKGEDGVHLRRLSLAGTGGQCLMSPPELKNGRMPTFWYNMGGVIMNLAASLAAFLLYLPFKGTAFGGAMLLFALIGVITGLTNGIPMHLASVDNDGFNALNLQRHPEAVPAFWVQMKVNEMTASGVRLRDMPEEWFTVPEDEKMQDSLGAAVAVIAANRLTDQHRFAESDALMEHILSIDSGMAGIHRRMLICDRMYIEAMGRRRDDVLEEMYGEEQKKLMKQMKNFPTVIRTAYTLALLWRDDREQAEKLLERFEKVEKSYPYPSDIASERELILLAQQRAEELTER